MKYFSEYSKELLNKAFFKEPEEITKNDKVEFLKMATGAHLVTPMTNNKIAENIIKHKYKDLITNVWDLEDGAGNIDENTLIENLKINLEIYNKEIDEKNININELPFIFIRVKNIEMLKKLYRFSNKLKYCNGIVIPKVEPSTIKEYLEIIEKINKKEKIKLYALPILEDSTTILLKDGISNILKIKDILDNYKDIVLNICVGGTDFSGKYGIRRTVKSDIYEMQVVNQCLTNILNIFTYENEYSVTAQVWEYFSKDINSQENIGLLNEIKKDRNNGMYSKVAIHPTQILPIQLSNCIEYEEYMDAIQIIEGNSKKTGVLKSSNSNKMNELNTHTIWANGVINRAKIFGVLNKNITCPNIINEFLKERSEIYDK